MQLPPMNAVRTFECAARHLSFSLAADELHVTPSAVSHQVKGLEDFLGVKLFRRQTRQISLTPEASQFLMGIQRGLLEISEATEQLLNNSQENLLLSVAPAFASGWLIPKLHGYYEMYPDTEVQIITSLKLVDFKNTNVHMAVRYGHGDWEGLDSDWIVEDELVPICSPGRYEKDQPSGPHDLKDQILLHARRKHDDWPNWFSVVGVEVNRAILGPEFQNTPLMVEAAVAGLGYGITNRNFIQHEIESGRLMIPFDIESQSGSAYYLVYPKEVALSDKLSRFRDWIISQAESLSRI